MSANKKMFQNVKLRLNITDFECEPEKITSILKMKPTLTWRQGDLISKTIMRHKQNGWRLEIPFKSGDQIEKKIKLLLKKINSHRKEFKKLPEKSDVEFSCVIYSYNGYRPGLNFDKKALKVLGELNASIDIDVYVL